MAELTSVLEIPVNVDSERLFPDDPGGITETVRLLAEAGASGCSIEDFRPSTGSILPHSEAADAVGEAAAACAEHGMVLTAAARTCSTGRDLDDTIARLIAPRGRRRGPLPAGAGRGGRHHPGRHRGRPVNAGVPGSPIDQLAVLGVRRASTGGALHQRLPAMRHDAKALLALQPD